MALFVGARLAGACAGATPIPAPARAARASGARLWIGALTLPSSARTAITQLVDASAGEDRGVLAAAFERLVGLATPLLDPPCRAEIRQLLASLRPA